MMLKLNRVLKLSFCAALLLAGLTMTAIAQQMKIVRAGEGGAFLIPELMIFIGVENKQLAVTDQLPTDRLPKAYQLVDIKKGDLILMVDGKKFATPEEMEKHYNSLTPGQEMKLGLKRGNEMLIASFKKADPSTLPKMNKMITVDHDDKSGDKVISSGKGLSIDGDPVPILEIGVILAAKDGKITVADIMPFPGMAELAEKPKAGDLFVSLQGNALKTAEALQSAWDMIPVGDTVRLVLGRDGKEALSVFAKPKAMGEIKLKKSN